MSLAADIHILTILHTLVLVEELHNYLGAIRRMDYPPSVWKLFRGCSCRLSDNEKYTNNKRSRIYCFWDRFVRPSDFFWVVQRVSKMQVHSGYSFLSHLTPRFCWAGLNMDTQVKLARTENRAFDWLSGKEVSTKVMTCIIVEFRLFSACSLKHFKSSSLPWELHICCHNSVTY